MNLLISMPGGFEWMFVFGLFSTVIPIIAIIFVFYHLYQQTKLLREIKDEIRRNGGSV